MVSIVNDDDLFQYGGNCNDSNEREREFLRYPPMETLKPVVQNKLATPTADRDRDPVTHALFSYFVNPSSDTASRYTVQSPVCAGKTCYTFCKGFGWSYGDLQQIELEYWPVPCTSGRKSTARSPTFHMDPPYCVHGHWRRWRSVILNPKMPGWKKTNKTVLRSADCTLTLTPKN